MEQTLNQILIDLIANATQAKDFLIEQIPDVIQQLLYWKAAESAAKTLLALVIVLLTGYLGIRTFNFARSASDSAIYDKGDPYFLWGLSWLVAAMAIIPAVRYLVDLIWLQILIAPKVYLIEYMASLVK